MGLKFGSVLGAFTCSLLAWAWIIVAMLGMMAMLWPIIPRLGGLVNWLIMRAGSFWRLILLLKFRKIKMVNLLFQTSLTTHQMQHSLILSIMKLSKVLSIQMIDFLSSQECPFLMTAHQAFSQSPLIGIKLAWLMLMLKKIVGFLALLWWL